jgi:hypothetical protein
MFFEEPAAPMSPEVTIYTDGCWLKNPAAPADTRQSSFATGTRTQIHTSVRGDYLPSIPKSYIGLQVWRGMWSAIHDHMARKTDI